MKVIEDRVRTIFADKAELDELDMPSDDRAAAIADIERAESRGFLFCQAVFVDGSYDGLSERAHPTDARLNWGRGQDVTKRNFFRDGQLVRDPEWEPEPPEALWESHGLRCHVVLVPRMGHRCGYVGVPPGHPWFKIGYDDCTRTSDCPIAAEKAADPDGYHSCYGHSPGGLVGVHGGLTYAALEADGWWYFGFDCAHSGDAPSPEALAKQEREYGFGREGHHWTLAEVRAETEDLATQLAKAR